MEVKMGKFHKISYGFSLILNAYASLYLQK